MASAPGLRGFLKTASPLLWWSERDAHSDVRVLCRYHTVSSADRHISADIGGRSLPPAPKTKSYDHGSVSRRSCAEHQGTRTPLPSHISACPMPSAWVLTTTSTPVRSQCPAVTGAQSTVSCTGRLTSTAQTLLYQAELGQGSTAWGRPHERP